MSVTGAKFLTPSGLLVVWYLAAGAATNRKAAKTQAPKALREPNRFICNPPQMNGLGLGLRTVRLGALHSIRRSDKAKGCLKMSARLLLYFVEFSGLRG